MTECPPTLNEDADTEKSSSGLPSSARDQDHNNGYACGVDDASALSRNHTARQAEDQDRPEGSHSKQRGEISLWLSIQAWLGFILPLINRH
jgi:hypothetical protein